MKQTFCVQYILYTLSISLPVFEVSKQKGVSAPELLHCVHFQTNLPSNRQMSSNHMARLPKALVINNDNVKYLATKFRGLHVYKCVFN
jgi:hypothetical protein